MHNHFSKIIFVLLLLILSGCDLISTRDAEEPDSGRTSFRPATTVNQLILNIKNSISEKVEKDYMTCFVDSSFLSIPFNFQPSSEAIGKFTVLSEWDLDSEQTYFRNLVNAIGQNQYIAVNLEELSISITSQSGTGSYNYTINLPFIDESTPEIFEGNAFFQFNLDNNNQWVITEWLDTKTSDNPTWSELKGRFYIF